MASTEVKKTEHDMSVALTSRAMRRSGWSRDGIALVSVFVTGVITLRVLANVFIAVDITARGGQVHVWQFVAAHAVILVSIASWTAVRRVVAVRLALGGVPLFRPQSEGRRFARRCELRSLFVRAGFLVPMASATAMCVAASILARADAFQILSVAGAALIGVIVLPAAVALFAARIRVESHLLEVIQLVGLLAILSANPDVAPSPGGAVAVIFQYRLSTDPLHLVPPILVAGALPFPACGVLFLVDMLGRVFTGRVPRSALMVWYRRISTGPWVIVIAVMLPVIVSRDIEDRTRRWLSAAALACLIGWFVGMVGRMDRELTYAWNRPLARRSRISRLAPILAIHLALAAALTAPGLLR